MPENIKQILSSQEISKALKRLTHQILEKNSDLSQLVLIGIQTRGVYLAERIKVSIEEIAAQEVPLGILGITFYRDDLTTIGPSPIVKETKINFALKDKRVVLVDDVLFTGRTIRAALDEIVDFGRPQSIELLVLVDRGHRQMPVKADFVGKNIPTSLQESVEVKIKEVDGIDEVTIIGKA